MFELGLGLGIVFFFFFKEQLFPDSYDSIPRKHPPPLFFRDSYHPTPLHENSTGKRSMANLRKTRDLAVAFINKTEKRNIILADAINKGKKQYLEEDIEVKITSYEDERKNGWLR